MSPMERMPSIMLSSTTGTTMNFKRFTKMSPKGFKYVAVKSASPAK